MPADKSHRFPASLNSVVARRWQTAAVPPGWNLTREGFQRALERSASRRFADSLPDDRIVAGYLESLHLSDLALACACSAGDGAAWEYFIAHYRPELYRAARMILSKSGGNDSKARELADSLYADLYGLRESSGGSRRSLFDYFHGRSKLSTWLHAILAQRHIDEIRRTQKMDSVDDPGNGDSDARELPEIKTPPDPERDAYLAIMQACVTAALRDLAPRDRLRLAYYYVDDLTLAQIGKLVGEHEATVSRKLERTRADLRRCVEVALREEKKLTEAQLKLCFEYARQQWPFDLTRALSARD
ncbi:MAG TPA: sigma-70 family RNA polymerase sigma factor [Candidatus Acidoferrales bacterium]|nr:sigma-70 family RNA polymerase sigma factor [Candidatus Acidoferrales bacterium]